jgi:hypothetical protein
MSFTFNPIQYKSYLVQKSQTMDHRIDMTAERVFIKMASAAFRAKTKD